MTDKLVMLVGWATAMAMSVTLAVEFMRRAKRSWPVVMILACCCAAIGAAAWDGIRAESLPFERACDEAEAGINPGVAAARVYELVSTRAFRALKIAGRAETHDGMTARIALHNLAEEASH
jgi:hypothetical protein